MNAATSNLRPDGTTFQATFCNASPAENGHLISVLTRRSDPLLVRNHTTHTFPPFSSDGIARANNVNRPAQRQRWHMFRRAVR